VSGTLLRTDLFTDARQRHIESLSRSNSAFGRPFAILFGALATILVTLIIEGLASMRVAIVAMLLLPVIAAFCAAPVARLLERRLHLRYRRELAEAQRRQQETDLRLLVLQAQLEPHFLFNTLASLRALLREDVDQSEKLLDALVSHLRSVLPVIRRDVGASTLSDQLAICSSYLDLMSIRLDGRLSYHIDVPDSLLDAVVPPLMLLTLVENAIKHGIEPKGDAGCIWIEARRRLDPAGDCVIVEVTDNGAGPAHAKHAGLGLQNLSQQLALRYADRASLALASSAAGGTIASLHIPHELARAT
jgi:sensor histidine kinase YesM